MFADINKELIDCKKHNYEIFKSESDLKSHMIKASEKLNKCS